MGNNIKINGTVEKGFEKVRESFIENFNKFDEHGASCSVYVNNKRVVHLWGGFKDLKKNKPWEEETPVLVFSTSKGLAVLTLALAHSRGQLDYDQKISIYWPEFAQNGKGDITVRQLLAHQAGLSFLDQKLSPELIADTQKISSLLAVQKSVWRPGDFHGYHAFTIGLYVNEILKRVDPKTRDISQYFKEEFAEPLGLNFELGNISEDMFKKRAELSPFLMRDFFMNLKDNPLSFLGGMFNPFSITFKSLLSVPVKSPTDLDTVEYLKPIFPSANGVGTADSIAKLYGEFASGGGTLDLNPKTIKELKSSSILPLRSSLDRVMKQETKYNLGFIKPFESFKFASESAFGTSGAGGSFGFADPDFKLGYGYAPNKMGLKPWNDPRDENLRTALFSCLKKRVKF